VDLSSDRLLMMMMILETTSIIQYGTNGGVILESKSVRYKIGENVTFGVRIINYFF
jgi:hypothetical protein